MATDDRDSDSANPSKSFKVGEFDRLSGFFTPVWESKRRLRAESPIPSSSAAASAPSSARGADKAPASRPSSPPPSAPRRSSPPPAPTRRPSSPPPAATSAAVEQRPSSAPPAPAQRPSSPPPARRSSAPPAATATAPAQPSSSPPPAPEAVVKNPLASNARAASPPRASSPPRARAKAPAPPASPAAADVERTPLIEGEVAAAQQPAPLGAPSPGDEGAAATLAPAGRSLAGASSSLPAKASVGHTDDPSEGDARVAAALHAAAAVTVRPVIPMPTTPVRPAARTKTPSSSPSPAAVASSPAPAQPGREASRERQPELRAPERRGSELRAARVAATAQHDKLRAKLASDSVDTFARHRETESEREALQAAAARAAATPADPYSSQLLRQLRRTIHLSTPLPEPVRQMLEKYRY